MIFNDYEVVVAGLAVILRPFTDRIELVDAEPLASGRCADVILYDLFAAPMGRQARFDQVVETCRASAVVAYSFITDPRAVSDTLAAGAAGYLSKTLSAEELVHALEQVAQGQRVTELGEAQEECDHLGPWPGQEAGLTPREAEMLALITSGMTNQEICEARYLSINTVKTYIRTAYRKIGVTTRPQAVAWSLHNGLERPSAPYVAGSEGVHALT